MTRPFPCAGACRCDDWHLPWYARDCFFESTIPGLAEEISGTVYNFGVIDPYQFSFSGPFGDVFYGFSEQPVTFDKTIDITMGFFSGGDTPWANCQIKVDQVSIRLYFFLHNNTTNRRQAALFFRFRLELLSVDFTEYLAPFEAIPNANFHPDNTPDKITYQPYLPIHPSPFINVDPINSVQGSTANLLCDDIFFNGVPIINNTWLQPYVNRMIGSSISYNGLYYPAINDYLRFGVGSSPPPGTNWIPRGNFSAASTSTFRDTRIQQSSVFPPCDLQPPPPI